MKHMYQQDKLEDVHKVNSSTYTWPQFIRNKIASRKRNDQNAKNYDKKKETPVRNVIIVVTNITKVKNLVQHGTKFAVKVERETTLKANESLQRKPTELLMSQKIEAMRNLHSMSARTKQRMY